MQSVSSQPFRRMPFNCFYRSVVSLFTVSCPFGAYISIRLWRRPITLRTDTARQRLHSTLIMPSAFLNPINWVPQFGQYQENGYQVSLHSSTSDPLFLKLSEPHRKTVHLLVVAAALSSENERYQNGLPMFHALCDISTFLAFHPPVRLFKIQTAVHCATYRTA